MTPQERILIMKVADRLKQAGPQTKDAEAEQLIRQQIASHTDSVYLLTQAVIVQEYGLEQAQQRIQDLERELEQARQPQAASPAAGGSFLGSMFGAGAPAGTGPGAGTAGAGSAGSSGSTSATSAMQAGSSAKAAASRTAKSKTQQAASPQRGGGMGDFMRSAAAMAVGVAGGHMLFNGLQGMFADDETATADSSDPAASADAADADSGADASVADSGGGWGADQGVTEEALAGDGSEWQDSPPVDDGGGWAESSGDDEATADSGFGGEDFDDGGMDDDWG